MRSNDVVSLSEETLVEGCRLFFDRFHSSFETAVHSVTFTSAGLSVLAKTDDKFISQLIENGHTRTSKSTSDLNILHICGTENEQMPTPHWTARYFEERRIETALHDTPYRFHFYDQSDFWQFYDRNRGLAIQYSPNLGQTTPWESGSPLRNFIHWHLLEKGSGLVHAGTLGRQENGILLCGAGGSGKSGTVLSGLMHGLQSVGDDYVAVHLGQTVTASCAFQTLKIDAAGANRVSVPSSLLSGRPLNWQNKHLVRLSEISPDQPKSMRLHAIVQPQISHAARTTFQHINAKEAFLSLAPTGVSQIPGARPGMVRICAELTRKLPAYKMSLGTDPVEISDSIDTFIGSIQ